MVPRLSSIGRQAAEQAAAAFASAASSSLEPISALAASSTSSTVGATAPRPTRAAVTVPSLIVRLTPTPTTAMSISVRGIMRKYASLEPGGRGGSVKLDENLAGLQIGAAGTGGHVLHLDLAAAVRALHGDDGAGGDHRGHAVAGGRAVAEIAAGGRPALHLLGTDQVDGLEHAGPDLAEILVFRERHAGDGGADAKAAIGGLLDRGHLGDFLDVDDHAGLEHPGSHLHQQIRSAGQDARGAAGFRKCADRFVKRSGRQVSEFRHGLPPSPILSARPIWAMALYWPGSASQAYTAGGGWNSLRDQVDTAGSYARGGACGPDCTEAAPGGQ